MRKINDEVLIMIKDNTHRLPYGTMLNVVAEHNNKQGWICEVAEVGNRVYVPKSSAKVL